MNLRFGGVFESLGLLPKDRGTRRLILDVIVVFGLATVARVVTLDLDLFEKFYDYSRAHEDFELDELMVTLVIASLAMVIFALRRMQDQRRELKLRMAAEQHALILALKDPLTGLPNRRRFQEALAAVAADRGARHAVLLIDLDGFKQLNDVFGHAAGDAALQKIAERLRLVGNERALSARLGGDEFAILIRNVANADEVEELAERLIAEIDVPIMMAGVEHRLTASVGIALTGDDAELSEEHLRRADVALYRAKREPGSVFVTYDTSMDAELSERFHFEKDLRDALAAREIVPNYQPIVNLKTGEIIKFEALARWQHPTRGYITPTVFVALAEDRGLIGELTEVILRQACRDALSWPASIRLSVNLSPLLLKSESFGLRIATILSEASFPASRLELEITERAFEDADLIRPRLENLRSLGIRIALDDFGTGYSSLSRLKSLAFDDLKIDRSFVQSMADNEDRMLFVRTILQLGRGLGMSVTAEGIEEPEQRDMLAAEGCAQGQGYLFSKAVPAERVHLLLATLRRAAG